jgi:hypothetical protein
MTFAAQGDLSSAGITGLRRRVATAVGVVVASLTIAPLSEAVGQFATPLPRTSPRSAPTTAGTVILERDTVVASVGVASGVLKARLDSVAQDTTTADGRVRLQDLLESLGARRVGGEYVLVAPASRISAANQVMNRIRRPLRCAERAGSPTAADGAAGLSLFSRLSSGFTSDRAYVQTSALSGMVGRQLFEVTYAQVVAAGEGAATVAERQQLRDNTSTVIRLVQNGGAATARLLVPIGGCRDVDVAGGTMGTGYQLLGGTVRLNLVLSGAALGRSSETDGDDQRGAVGSQLEALGTWGVRGFSGSNAGLIALGVRGGTHFVANGRIVPEVASRWMPVYQAVFLVRAAEAIGFGVTATAVPRGFREFVPRANFVVSASIL